MKGAANSTMNNNVQLKCYIKNYMHYGQSDLRIQWKMISIYQKKSTSLENRSESSIEQTESMDARTLLCCQSCAGHQRILPKHHCLLALYRAVKQGRWDLLMRVIFGFQTEIQRIHFDSDPLNLIKTLIFVLFWCYWSLSWRLCLGNSEKAFFSFFSKHISGLHTAFWPRDALLSETAWH